MAVPVIPAIMVIISMLLVALVPLPVFVFESNHLRIAIFGQGDPALSS
jgi:hypothetical protein